MKTLRTPEHHFENLPGFSYPPHYLDYEGIRMHYIDEGQGEETLLALHGGRICTGSLFPSYLLNTALLPRI